MDLLLLDIFYFLIAIKYKDITVLWRGVSEKE